MKRVCILTILQFYWVIAVIPTAFSESIDASSAGLTDSSDVTGVFFDGDDSNCQTEEVHPVSEVSEVQEKIDCLIEDVRILISQGDIERAEELIAEAEKLAADADYTEGLALVEAKKGDVLIVQGRYGSAIEVLEEAYDRFGETDASLSIGNLLATAHRFHGNYNEAFQLYTRLLEIIRDMDDPILEAGVEQNLAVVYDYFGDTTEALERYFNSLQIAESEADTSLQAILLNNIGELYSREGNYTRAKEFIQESLDLSLIIDSPGDVSRAYLNLGTASRNLEELEEAINYYRQSLEISNSMGNVVRPVQILFNMGNVYLDQGDYERARESFEESLELSRQHNIIQGDYYNNIGMGDLFQSLDEFDEAIERYRQAQEVAEQLDSAEWKRTSLYRMSESYESAERWPEAFSALKTYQSLSDSLQEQDQREALARYETLFDLRSERRQNQLLEEKVQAQNTTILVGITSLLLILMALIALSWMYKKQRRFSLNQQEQNRELTELYQQVSEQKEELTELNTTKNKLFSILAHDLRSPISQLQALVYLIHEDELDQVDQQEVLQRIDKQMFNSIHTLENYLSWAQNQLEGMKPRMQPVNIYDKLVEVTNTMEKEAQSKGVALHNLIDRDVTVMADENMIRIILQNLISNSIKFCNNGDDITVKLEKKGKNRILKIVDTGIGIPEEKQANLFQAFNESRKGTNDEAGTGLGLSICREFAEKQNARIWFESQPGAGTTFFIELTEVDIKAKAEALPTEN